MDDKLTFEDIKDKTLQKLLREFMQANADEEFEINDEYRKKLIDTKHEFVKYINKSTILQGFK